MNAPFTREQVALDKAIHDQTDYVAIHARLSAELRAACTPEELKQSCEPVYYDQTVSFEEFFDALERKHFESTGREVPT